MKVTASDFNREKEFVKAMARALNLDIGEIRVAVITYGGYPVNVIKMGRYTSRRDFEYKLDLSRRIGGYRRVDKALQAAANVIVNSRSGVPRLVVLITAGEQSSEASSLDKAVQPLRKLGTKLFVIAVGSIANRKAYQQLASAKEGFFMLPGFDRIIGDTNRIVIALSKSSCKLCLRIIY